MIYEPMPMHLHTCHQPGGSMEGHIYNAKQFGMKYVRFTDHDTRVGRKKNQIKSFDFSKEIPVISEKPFAKHGFEFFGNLESRFEEGKLILSCSSESEEYERAGTYFFSDGTNHTVTLIAEVSVLLGLRFKLSGDAHLYLDVRLSQRPPDHKPAHLVYSFDGYEGQKTPHTERIPIEKNEEGLYRLALSDDMRERWEIGGLDNVFDTVLITAETRRGGTCEIILDKFEIEALHSYDEVIKRQRVVADKIGERYGVKPFVTTEISGAGQHKNVFSTKVPVIDYEELNYSVSEWDAVRHVKAHGGIFAYNHPFENNKFKKMKELTFDEVRHYVTNEAAYLISTKVFGADLMEVGFPEGRGCFSFADYTRLWDTLSLAGIFITGYGDSDSHKNDRSWYDANNFASWIAVDENSAFPVSEDELARSMKSGNVYMGDPVFLNFGVNFECEGATIGQVIYSKKSSFNVKFLAEATSSENTVKFIFDGKCAAEFKTCANEAFEAEVEYIPEYPLSFARIEMYNADGRCIMLTNPIYFANKEKYFGEIPKERIFEV